MQEVDVQIHFVSQKVAEQGGELLITVDNGIASIEGVAAARALGMRVLITDHRSPDYQDIHHLDSSF